MVVERCCLREPLAIDLLPSSSSSFQEKCFHLAQEIKAFVGAIFTYILGKCFFSVENYNILLLEKFNYAVQNDLHWAAQFLYAINPTLHLEAQEPRHQAIPFYHAAERNHREVLQFLVKNYGRQFHPFYPKEAGQSPFERYKEVPQEHLIHRLQQTGVLAPLHRAVQNLHKGVVEFLLKAYEGIANIQFENLDVLNNSPLELIFDEIQMVYHPSVPLDIKYQIAELLIQYGADIRPILYCNFPDPQSNRNLLSQLKEVLRRLQNSEKPQELQILYGERRFTLLQAIEQCEQRYREF